MAREPLLTAPEMQTRSWTPPTGYFLYSDLYDSQGALYENFASSDPTKRNIEAFFTRAGEDEPASSDPTYANYPYHGRLRCLSSSEKWLLSIRSVDPKDVNPGDYYVYGFIPGDAADDAAIARLSEETGYTEGATLTIKGLRTAGYDACVIIGAKEGPDADHDNGLTAGDFCFNLQTGEGVHNNLYLLFDHLCSALTVGIKVDGTYNRLRTIKLKQMTLQTATESGLMTDKADVVVTVNRNNTGSNPVTSLTYTPKGQSETGGTVFQSDEGLELTTDTKSFLTHFLPIAGVTKVVITCKYDVYDKKGNLIRKDCIASPNTIRLSDIIAYFPGVQRGRKYGINMTVVPTYVYVLSEPDLSDPGLEKPTMTVDP